jgi:hypothetical protein
MLLAFLLQVEGLWNGTAVLLQNLTWNSFYLNAFEEGRE